MNKNQAECVAHAIRILIVTCQREDREADYYEDRAEKALVRALTFSEGVPDPHPDPASK